ncbi:MAG: DUF1772 domain-containing protein [Syntrophobacteraceae bacterium]
MENIQHFAQLLTTLCSSVFAGAAVYVNLVEHPARMACGTILAATEFAPSYKRAAIMQASLAACGLIASVVAWLAGAPGWWLIGGILLGSVIPFILFFVMPINKELLNPSLDKGSDRTNKLLSRWGHLHAVRSVLSTTALLIFLYCLLSQ